MRRSLIAAFATLMLAACGGDDPSTNNAAAECSIDSDCSGGKVCRAALCTVVETEPRRLGFRLTPPPMSTYPPQVVPIRALPADEPVQIGLDPGVRVAGALSYIASERGPGSGRLKFRRTSDDFTGEATVTGNEYELFLPPGSYVVTFFPENPERPTRVWNDVDIELDTDPKLQLPEATVQILGTLSRTDPISRESSVVPNAHVFATNAESGVTSSVATTNESGTFAINVPATSGVYDLFVSPVEPNAYGDQDQIAYIPDAKFTAAFEVDENDWVNLLDENPDTDVLGVSLGEYGYSPLSIPFRLQFDGDIDWTGTTVTLRTEAGRGIVSIRQRLDAGGEFELPLVTGLYEAIVRTPPALPVRSSSISNIEVDPEGIVLTLEPRTNASGTVVGPSGDPLAGADVRFTPIEAETLAQPISVKTDADGGYAVWLEDEPYRLSVVPSDPSLPRHVSIVENGTVPAVVEIVEPVLVWGTILGTPSEGSSDSWRALPDVSVEVVEEDASGMVRVIGEGQSTESGDFKVVIGARP